MAVHQLIILIILFFVASAIGVVTGSNSLVTVPVMFQFGIDEKVAVATNMFGLTFMSVGATIPFIRHNAIPYRKVSPLVILTIVSSAIGAALVGYITGESLKLIVSGAMILVAAFILLKRDKPKQVNDNASSSSHSVSLGSVVLTLVLTFFLGIYGGLYSGGYVTVLTAVLAAFYGLSFLESIAATKFINLFSSFIATAVFMWQGLVDYRLGLILGVTMFVGAYAGAHYATKMNDVWLKRIFLATVAVLAVKTIIDLL